MCKHGNVFSLLILMDEDLTADILHSCQQLAAARCEMSAYIKILRHAVHSACVMLITNQQRSHRLVQANRLHKSLR